jgi:hypothetical protein
MTTEVTIDPNVRVRGGQTYSAFRHIRGDMPLVGEEVFVREPESNLVGKATVADINRRDRLIYLRVDWAALAPEKLLTPAQLMAKLAASASPTNTQPSAGADSGASAEWHSKAVALPA